MTPLSQAYVVAPTPVNVKLSPKQIFDLLATKVTVGNGLMVATTGLTLEQLFPSVPLI